jgi:uncharacterized protein with FMN-binding domain
VRTRAVLSSIFASLSILAIGAELGSATMQPTIAPSANDATPGPTSTPTSGATGDPTPAPTVASSAAKDGVYSGDTYSTRFGNVQVAVTISAGKITEVQALQLTDADGRSRQISNRAAPILRSEVLQSQSANVSNVSGATYTSQGYLSSLQSALDQAGFTS